MRQDPHTTDDARRARRPRLALWAVFAWLVIWQGAAMLLDSELLLPSPGDVCLRAGELAVTAPFWRRVAFSWLRVFAGFALGAVLGAGGAALAVRSPRAEEFLAPVIAVMKSVPVASITVLALVWLRASNLAVFVVLLVALPIMYENVAAGLRAQDPRLVEMARVFRIPGMRAFRLVTLPSLMSHVRAGLALALSMAWKAGVAAEVIGIPAGSLGEAIYASKVSFDTAALFAWTLAVVLASVASERVLRWALGRVEPWLTCAAGSAKKAREVARGDAAGGEADAFTWKTAMPAEDVTGAALRLDHVGKRYDAVLAVHDVSCAIAAGAPLCIMAPSGTGKTTLLRIVAGLEQADTGSVDAPRPVAMLFQEDRLAEQASLLTNARAPLEPGGAAWTAAPALLSALGLRDRLLAPASACSGGERRRCALARALLAPHGTLLLDEPFAGLDEATHATAARLVVELTRSTVVLVATHDPRDPELLGAQTLHLGATAAPSAP